MTDRDRVRLLFGPYQAPPLKAGDRAHCLFRDCAVVITSWTDAPIPWPRCRPLDAPCGDSGLLVDDVLAWAVRHESAEAIKFWWGVSARAVFNWRKALGVTRINNEGTDRLVHAAAQQGANAVKAYDWSDEQCDEHSRIALELDLGRFLHTGYHGPVWTKEQTAVLGTASDEEIAERIGRTPNAVRVMRTQFGIPKWDGNRWLPEHLALLGTLPDEEIAQRIGRSVSAVAQKRVKLGIPDPVPKKRGRRPRRTWRESANRFRI